jgi:hypothetical protein
MPMEMPTLGWAQTLPAQAASSKAVIGVFMVKP